MENNFAAELAVATKAVQICAALTQNLQRQTISRDSQTQKSDLSPVTIGDYAVQALLTSAIHGAFPSNTFLAEESSADLHTNEQLLNHVWELVENNRAAFSAAGLSTPKSKEDVLDLIDRGGRNETSGSGRTWVFDPIDGTATFLSGGQYAINCAFLVDGTEQVALIGCPNVAMDAEEIREDRIDAECKGTLLFAVRGQGAWKRQLLDETTENGRPSPASITRIPRHGDAKQLDQLVWTDCEKYTSTILPLHREIAAELGIGWPGVDLFSSLMKYSALTMGKASVCIRIFKFTSWRSNMWDHAGGRLLFEEVGGKVTDLDGNPIDFTKGRKMAANYGLVCAPSSVHAEVLRVVQQAIQRHGPIPLDRNSR